MSETINAEVVPDRALTVRSQNTQVQHLDPAGRKAALDDTLNKVALVMEVMSNVMSEGEHFGTIPGCGEKKVLLKSGAEKLGMTFRLKPTFHVEEREFSGQHREYRVTCTLTDGTQGVGTCSTLESKYRYRAGERKCPKCGKATIIAGKAEYGGGFLCFAKKGGCGAKFTADDKAITGQTVGKTEHDNPADFWNTCLKMGKKRAHVDAIITATACSDIFTQDVEEMTELADLSTRRPTPLPASNPKPANEPKKAAPTDNRAAVGAWLEKCKAKLLKAVASPAIAPLAWRVGVERGWILDSEPLANATTAKMFPSVNWDKPVAENEAAAKADFDGFMSAIDALSQQEPSQEWESKYALANIEEPNEPEPDETPEPESEPAGLTCTGTIEQVSKKAGKNPKGKPWTRFGVRIADQWFNTFDTKLGDKAESLKGQPVTVVYESGEYGNDLLEIRE